VIEQSLDGATGWVILDDGVRNATSYTVSGLTNGTRHYFRVSAKNAAGISAFSNITNTIPRTVPSAVRSLTATPTNLSRQVRLTWTVPESDGGSAITDYVIQQSLDGTAGWETIKDEVQTTTYEVTGLTNGTRYYFRVLATNAAGISASSNTANTSPRTVPSAVRSLTATATNLSGQIRLAWTAPASNGGVAVTDYVIQRSPNGTSSWVTVNDGVRTTTSYTVAGLSNGIRYYFRVIAKNVAGIGASSSIVNQIPRTVPSAPRTVTAVPGSRRVVLKWTPPASTGGTPITRYTVQRSTSPTTGWRSLSTSTPATARSFTATNLRNGTRYYFRIAAVNAAGMGTWSARVSATPR
jgi:fibronectin type 3 domain-containing protein